ncbi:MAG: bacillithiol biosynthesis deacetylase BshB1 [Flavobacteriaceae bacterium]|nr:bacillithiol biosynthesis deacetylase BshB1 [Flavobacteriaceae bacterium]
MKLDILAFGSHPDDVELGCSGTLAKEISKGKKVGIIDLTRGELGTRGTAETRDVESEEAAKILGVSVRLNMEFADGFFVNDKWHQIELIKMIRRYQPEIVFCNAVDDRHIDHAKGSQLVSDACFLSGLLKVDTKDDDGDGWQDPWRPKQVYHYIQWKNLKPDFVVDVTGFMDKKMDAVLAYKTQFYDPNSEEPETLISSKNFTDSVRYRARDMGRLVGTEYAEGFTAERYPAVDSVFDLI